MAFANPSGDFIIDVRATTVRTGTLFVGQGGVVTETFDVGGGITSGESVDAPIVQASENINLINGDENNGYVLTSDSSGTGTWKTKLWKTNDDPELRDGPSTDGIIFTDDDITKIGFGTSTPDEKLNIVTTTAGEGAQIGNLKSGVWLGNNNHAALIHSNLKTEANSYGLKLEQNGAVHLNSKNNIQMRIDNSYVVNILSDGKVGLGVSTPTENLHVADNVLIEGNLTVNGNTTTVNSETLSVTDPLIQLATGTINDLNDIGFYGNYLNFGVTTYTGLYRDSSDNGLWKLFENVTTTPTSVIPTGGNLAKLRLDAIEIETGITFDTTSVISHNNFTLAGYNGSDYIDNVFFKNTGRIGLGVTAPDSILHIDSGDIIINTGNIGIVGTGSIGIGTINPPTTIYSNTTDSHKIPAGTTLERPSDTSQGHIRYNTLLNHFEGYGHSLNTGITGWIPLNNVVTDNDHDTKIIADLNDNDEDILRFYTDGTERMKIGITGNMAIGITVADSPISLTIYNSDALGLPSGNNDDRPSNPLGGYFRFNKQLGIFEGHNGSVWQSFTSGVNDLDGDTFLTAEFSEDEDGFRFIVADNLHSVFDVNGNIGVGITVPDTMLHLQRSDASTLPLVKIENTDPNGDSSIMFINTDNTFVLGTDATDGSFRIADGDTLENTNRFTILSNGYIGLGITNPSSFLDIKTDLYDSNSETAVNIRGSLLRIGDETTNSTQTNGLGIKFYDDSVSHASLKYDSSNNKFLFGTSTSSEYLALDGTSSLSIDNINTRIGVGTDTPRSELHLHEESATGTPRLQFTNSDTTATDDTQGFMIEIDGNEDAYIWNYETKDIFFGTDNTTRMIIESTGNIGIAQSSPQHLLDINGTTKTIDLIVDGDLTINGTFTTIESSTLEVDDSLIFLSKNNLSDILDIGFAGQFLSTGVSKYSGLFRDADTNYFRLFTDLEVKPTTYVDTSHGTYTKAKLEIKTLDTENIDYPSNLEIRNTGSSEPRFIITSNGNVGIGVTSSNPLVSLQIDKTDAIKIPKGTTAEQPTGVQGYIRYNTTLNRFEGFGAGSEWGSLGNVIDIDEDTYITAQIDLDTEDDTLRFYTQGAQQMSILPNGFTGIGTALTPTHPFHVNYTNSGDWAAKIENTSTIFIGNTGGQALCVNSGVASSNTTYAVQVKNTSINPLFQINNSGKIGIGVAPAILSNPEPKLLEVATTTAGAGATFGNGFIGVFISDINTTTFSHIDFSGTAGSFAIKQKNDGETNLNSATSKTIIFSIAGTEKMTLGSNGYLGIGDNDPLVPLQVLGKDEDYTAIFDSFDSESTVSIAHDNGTGILIESGVTSGTSFDVQRSGTSILRVFNDNNGTVGIRTDTPSTELLHIYTTTIDEGALIGNAKIGVATEVNTYAQFAHTGASTQFNYALKQNTDGYTHLNSSSTQDISFRNNNVEIAVLKPSGRFGIGTNDPNKPLHVQGDARIVGDLTVVGDILYEGPSVENLFFQDSLIKLASDNTVTDLIDIGFYGVYGDEGSATYTGLFRDATDKKWKFFTELEEEPSTAVTTSDLTYADGFLAVGDLDINNILYVSNNIGVGITNPTISLQLETSDAILIPKGITIERPTVGVTDGYFRYNSENKNFEGYSNGRWESFNKILSDLDKDTRIEPEFSDDEDKLRFFTAGNQTMVLDSSGRLGIGVSTPTEFLEVNGNAKATTFITVSDKQIKTNIKILDPNVCLNNIKQIDVFEYNFTEKYLKSTGVDNKKYQGLIAQDVEKIIPTAIEYSSTVVGDEVISDFRSINQNIIISQLLGAVKALTTKVENMQEKINLLKIK